MCSEINKNETEGVVKEAVSIIGRVTVFGFLLGLSTLAFLFGGLLLFLSIMGLAAMVWWFPYIFMAAIPFVLIIAAVATIFKK